MTITKKAQVRKEMFMNMEMRMYVAKAMTAAGREIKCEKCGAYENLEFHHLKYAPENVTIKDIVLLCPKCHRNSKIPKELRRSRVRTIFENGKRFCETSHYKFEY